MATERATATTRLPAALKVVLALLVFLGVTAVAGGVGLVTDVGGMAPPADWLDGIPIIDSWLVPGLVLGVGFGFGSLLAAYGVMRRPWWASLARIEHASGHHWSWLATILIGVGQALWIGLELVYLSELSVLQLLYGPLGLALAVLPFTPSVSRYLKEGGLTQRQPVRVGSLGAEQEPLRVLLGSSFRELQTDSPPASPRGPTWT